MAYEINFCETKEQLKHLGEVVTGKADGSPAGSDIEESTLSYTGQVRTTLPELLAKIGWYSVGAWSSSPLISNDNQYVVYNGDRYVPLSTPYQVNSTLNPNPELLVGTELKLITDIKYTDLTDTQEELLPLGSQIYPPQGTLKNGETVTAGTTHLRVEIDSKPTIVEMYPQASGIVSALTDDGATIGGGAVFFLGSDKDIAAVKPSSLGAGYYNSILARKGRIHFDAGFHDVEATVYFNENSNITFHPDAVFRPTVDGIAVLSADSEQTAFSNVFNLKIYDMRVDLSGHNSCVGFVGWNFRNNSGLYRPEVVMGNGTNNIGIDYKKLCWSTDLVSPRVFGGGAGSRRILIRNGSNAVTVKDSKGNGGNPDYGVEVINGLDGTFDEVNTFPTTSTRIDGGLQQECSLSGLHDSAIGTTTLGMYFEKCEDSDVFYDGAIMPNHLDSCHLADQGATCIKGRNTKGADINGLNLNGSRSFGLFDFDDSNEYCYADKQRTAALNIIEGDTTGLKLKTNMSGTLPVGDIGMEDGIAKAVIGTGPASARKRSITNGFDSVSILGAGTVVNIAGASRVFRKNVSDGTALTVSGTPVNGQTIYLALRGSDLGAATITFEGKPIQTDNFGSPGTKNALIECMYLGDLSKWMIGPSWWT